jgi:hypothetical protein
MGLSTGKCKENARKMQLNKQANILNIIGAGISNTRVAVLFF